MAAPKMTPFAVQLRAARDAAGLSAAELAMLVGVTPITIRRWEAASGEPTVSQLVILAFALNRTASDLLDGTEPSPNVGFVGRLIALEQEVRELRKSSD